jgi:hypothetical protein
MKKIFLATIVTIVFGIYFGLIGSPMLIEYLHKVGFLTWLADNEWFASVWILSPFVFLIPYYCTNKEIPDEQSKTRTK